MTPVRSGWRAGSKFSPVTAAAKLSEVRIHLKVPAQKSIDIKKIKQVVEPVNQEGLPVEGVQAHLPGGPP